MPNSDTEALTRSVENLSAAVEQKISAFERRLQATNERIGSIVIPAASRRAGISSRPVLEMARDALPAAAADMAMPSFSAAAIASEHAAMGNFLRRGDASGFDPVMSGMGGITELSASGMSESSAPDGGFLVAPVLSTVIQEKIFDVSPLGKLARKVQIDTGDGFEEPIDPGDIDAQWVGELDARPTLDTAQLKYLRVPVNEVYTNQPVTQRLLDDSRFNIGQWLEAKIADKFARTEGHAFVWGDGVSKPLGLLAGPHTADIDGVRDWFTLQDVATLAAHTIAVPDLFNLVYSLRAPYRPNARWLMNLKTAGNFRTLQDPVGRYVWSDAIAEAQPPTLAGFPVEFDEEMPDIADGAAPVAFGDIEKAYIVVEKVGVKMLVDPYTSKPNVLFYAYRRVGGSVQNGEAVKLLRVTAV